MTKYMTQREEELDKELKTLKDSIFDYLQFLNLTEIACNLKQEQCRRKNNRM